VKIWFWKFGCLVAVLVGAGTWAWILGYFAAFTDDPVVGVFFKTWGNPGFLGMPAIIGTITIVIGFLGLIGVIPMPKKIESQGNKKGKL
jgi:hypothetical protein